MKFYCEYCRNQIDAEKDKKCPTCKASYKDNKEYRRLLEEQEKQKEQAKEQQEYVKKTFKRIGITSGVFAIVIPVIIIAIMGTIIFVGIKEARKNNNKYDDVFKNVEENLEQQSETKEIDPIMVNEEKTSSDYKVKFEKYKLLEQAKDKEFNKLEVTLVVEKISDKFSAWGEDFYCLVNNVSQNVDRFNSDMTTYIKDKNIPATKKLTYYIPKNTTSFDIKYGNEISFHINIQND